MIVLLLLAASCGECHADEEKAFAASRHARAFTWPIFRVAYAHASTHWCDGCHRPDPTVTTGLTCTSCHVATADHAAPAPRNVCARCHEFNTPLPDAPGASSAPLQSTVSEAKQRRCTACHDPHAAKGGHAVALVKSVLHVTARAAVDATEITVSVGDTGHRFPTGDPFRRLAIAVCEDEACATKIAEETFGRSFGMKDGIWQTIRDRRFEAGETRVLRLPPAAFWQAVYLYGDPTQTDGLAEGEIGVRLASGLVTSAANR